MMMPFVGEVPPVYELEYFPHRPFMGEDLLCLLQLLV